MVLIKAHFIILLTLNNINITILLLHNITCHTKRSKKNEGSINKYNKHFHEKSH